MKLTKKQIKEKKIKYVFGDGTCVINPLNIDMKKRTVCYKNTSGGTTTKQCEMAVATTENFASVLYWQPHPTEDGYIRKRVGRKDIISKHKDIDNRRIGEQLG